MDLKLTKKHRLSDSAQISLLRRKGKKIIARPFVVYVEKNGLGYPRIAIALTRKSGKSVVRNRVRRKIREFARKNKTLLGNLDLYFFSSVSLENDLASSFFESLVSRLLTVKIIKQS